MKWTSGFPRAASCHRRGVSSGVCLALGMLLDSSCTHGVQCARTADCFRAKLAPFVPKLDLRWQLHQARSDRSAGNADLAARASPVDQTVVCWLRWQPTIYAAQVPDRYELSPAAWVAPCELEDTTCFAELAESEGEIREALQQEERTPGE